MKKYAVAITSLYDNITNIEIIEAESELEAAFDHTQAVYDRHDFEEEVNMDKLETYYFDADHILAVKEIK